MPDGRPPPDPFSFALVGAGKVGTTVASLLREAGHHPAGVVSRSEESARDAGAGLGAPVFELGNPPPADVYLLGVPDAALVEVARAIVGAAGERSVLVHFAGSLGVEAIARATDHRRVAALHPVQAFADRTSARARLPGSAWGITCAAELDAWCIRVVERDLGGRPVRVSENDRELWHAAAVMTSNVLAAVVTAGASVLARIGIPDPAAVLGPLARGTLDNVMAAGAGAASITGPVVRGEPGTIARHLAALAERAPDLWPAYVAATRTVVAVARSSGRIDGSEERAFLEELGIS